MLAGPILRTVTETSVTVWLALKESAAVTLTICEGDSTIAPTVGSPGTAHASKIGPNLYIVAVTASLSPAKLTLGKLYFYRLSFATAGGTKDLLQATGAKDATAFSYAPFRLPSFLLPPSDIEQVRFALGSCRKTHTPGTDALALLDDLLSANVSSPPARPQILVLGGDQIYADEVTETLLMMLTDAGLTLLGQEELPLSSDVSTSPELCPPSTRTKIMKQAGFTSDDTRSHLMGLGEYLTMYLFAWSDVLWADPRSGMPVVPAVEDVLDLVKHADDLEAAKKLKRTMLTQRSCILVTYSTLPRVRRALANIATYMILDDHEITDDFNMQRRFCDKVYGSPLGMRVVQNGLIAYALCQHWGNCPDQFMGTAPGARLLGLFASANGYVDLARNPDLQKIVGLHTPASSPPALRTPSFTMPIRWCTTTRSRVAPFSSSSPTRARGERSREAGQLAPPDLIQESQFAVQIGRTPALRDRLLMVLVTTNMPPCPSIRQAGRDLPGLPGHSYDFEDFFDGWQIEQIDFARMIVAMAKKAGSGGAASPFANRVVLLSGDVHSSQATRLSYQATQQVGDPAGSASSARVVFVQIVASALHNQSDATLGEHVDGYTYLPSFTAHLGAQPVLLTEGFVGWNPVTTAKGTQVGTQTTMFPMASAALEDPGANAGWQCRGTRHVRSRSPQPDDATGIDGLAVDHDSNPSHHDTALPVSPRLSASGGQR